MDKKPKKSTEKPIKKSIEKPVKAPVEKRPTKKVEKPMPRSQRGKKQRAKTQQVEVKREVTVVKQGGIYLNWSWTFLYC